MTGHKASFGVEPVYRVLTEHGVPISPSGPDRLCAADLYLPAWTGIVYAAFTIDAYSRWIVGRRTATTMRTSLLLDAQAHALWTRRRVHRGSLAGLT
jgi:putative transposase